MSRQMPKEIKAVGVELEGGFTTRQHARRPKGGGAWHGDGSVYIQGWGGWQGEAVSKPIRTWRQLKRWISRNYPRQVNKTCGLHVHLSFNDNTPSLLAENRAFQDYHIKQIANYVKTHLGSLVSDHDYEFQMSRLSGNHTYCSGEFQPINQLSRRGGGGRYTMLNFSSFKKHGTLEIRTLGMMHNKKAAIDLVWIVIKAVRDYSRKLKATNKYKGRHVLAEESIYLDETTRRKAQQVVLTDIGIPIGPYNNDMEVSSRGWYTIRGGG